MEDAAHNPGQMLVLLDRLLRMPPYQLWPLAGPLVSSIKCLLMPGIPRKVLGEDKCCFNITIYKMITSHLSIYLGCHLPKVE